MKKCAVCGLEEGWLVDSKKYNMILCRKHYMIGQNTGNPFTITKRAPNNIVIYDKHAEIILNNDKQEEVARTKISLDKLEIVKQHKWHKSNKNYVITFVKRKCLFLHKLIAGNDEFVAVDHINGDTLDNRNENLRACTLSQNQWNRKKNINNSSGVPGVSYSVQNKGWMAQMTHNKKYYYLGTYSTKEEAIKARKEAEQKYRKDFVRREG
jgi:hypothetical protein